MIIPAVTIVGTTDCDAHCSFCDRWREPVTTMDPDLASRTIDELPRFWTRLVDFSGGQPGLWPGTQMGLDQCLKKGIPTTITTSGPSSFRMVDWQSKIGLLRISVHGTAEEQDEFQQDGFWAANLDFLKAVAPSRRPRTTELIFTIRKDHTAASFEAVDRLARRFGTRIICNLEWGLTLNDRLLELIHQYRRRPLWVCSLAKLRFYQRGGNNRKHPTCAADRMVVLYGNQIVQPCLELRGRLPSIPLGSNSLKELLRSPERTGWRKQTGRWDFCSSCTISCPNMLGLAINCFRRYAAWLHLPTFAQRLRDEVLLALE